MIEEIYTKLSEQIINVEIFIIPYARRLLRLLALPYCYFKLVNWDECKASHYQVAKDFIYIFFKLKYFPDNYSQCRFWELDQKKWADYYGSIYDAYQRASLRKDVQRAEYRVLFDDKEVCYQLCIGAGLPLPKQYTCIDKHDDYRKIIRSILTNDVRELIIKPVRGSGGKGIAFATKDGNNITVKTCDREYLLDDFILISRSVIQEVVCQHQALAYLYQHSINTVRIQTLLTREKEVIILGAMIRFGRDNRQVDNLSSGGLGVGIDLEKGILKEYGHDFRSKKYTSHPTTGVPFLGYKVPYWNVVKELVGKTQLNFAYYKLLGHDIAITPTGPVIIEINAEPDNVMMEQCYGPILEDTRVRAEFINYGLLLN